ncbi:MAG TPA: site-specific DNA-methyltransferase [Acidimicrobiales bacterium]|nr:site-specific DNA-methyltransferase [Acidimicrobiales bacterium]
MARRSTTTSAFGVSKRESHDSSPFYRRFEPPQVSHDSEVAAHRALDKLIVGDARQMDEVPDSSVALVVTSPPYFAGKEYEEALGDGGVPATYLEYLSLLRDVFAECARKLEPGGRIAVNVANLGRRPYRSLSADVVGILQDDLGLLLRGEIIWVKQRGASGSCAWGSFQSPANPVLRDLTERVLVASKGRFDRAVPPKERARRGLPCETSMTRDDFMENTLDLWELPAESATRVGHPAPFPVELPARLIDLYTYRGDLVLDPFLGSGSTAVAAVRSGRHFAGYDLDESYVRLAESRVEEERRRAAPAGPAHRGRSAKELAASAVEAAGFTNVQSDRRQPGGVVVALTARDRHGDPWLFDLVGGFTTHRPGLERADVLWKALGRAALLREAVGAPLVWLTPAVAKRGPAADVLERVVGPGKPVRAVIDLGTPGGLQVLTALCDEGRFGSTGTDRVAPAVLAAPRRRPRATVTAALSRSYGVTEE